MTASLAAAGRQERESIIAADCGSSATGVAFVDRVDDDYRFVARGEALSTHWPPLSDASLAVRRGVYRIQEILGRRLMTDEGQLIIPGKPGGEGADAFVATTSAAPPLRVVVIALGRDLSLASARRAVASVYAHLEEVMVLADDGPRWGEERGAEAKIEALARLKPEVILVAGGFDGGAIAPHREIAHMIAAASALMEPAERPHVIFAGNREARPVLADRLSESVALHVVENVRPGLDVENLADASRELEEIYQQEAMAKLPGFAALAGLGPAPILPTSSAFGLVISFVSRQYGLRRVLGVDVGDRFTHLAAMEDGEFRSVVREGLGMGRGLLGLGKAGVPEGIARWLPDPAGADGLDNWLMNKTLRPQTVPQMESDRLIEEAVLREVVRAADDARQPAWRLRPYDLIVGRGRALSHAPRMGRAALALIDALEPVGVCQLALDALSIAPQVGAAAIVHPVAAAQVLDRDAFARLGALVAPSGREKEGQVALKFKMTCADGSVLGGDVPFGEIEILPLSAGEKATLELRPSRKLDVGLGAPGKGASVEVEGGAVGVILDARGRPLAIPDDPGERAEALGRWIKASSF